MDNLIHPFTFPVYANYIDNSSFKKIKQDTFDYIHKNKNIFKEGWECNTKTSYYERSTPFKSSVLEDQIKLHTEKYFQVWNFKSKLNLHLPNYWINIAEKGDFQESHDHAGFFKEGLSLFSGALYINVPKNSGSFDIFNPVTYVDYMPINQISPPDYHIIPKEGLAILFPSWLKHSVGVNRNDNIRISISWNVTVVN